ncbi:MAG: hypothetical protein ACXIVE_07950 [Salinarimonas sp.]
MFFLIRFIAIVGVIFYYSPERDRLHDRDVTARDVFDAPLRLGVTVEENTGMAATKSSRTLSLQEAGAIWHAVPEAARDRLAQEIALQLVQDGFSLRTTLGAGDESTGTQDKDRR